jgi:tetratricopeptide (TPR) repeat protein
MRFAVVVAPAGENVTVQEPLEALSERLMRGGFNVIRLATRAELARDLGRAVEGVDAGDSLLVYIAGALRVEGDDAVGLALSGVGVGAAGPSTPSLAEDASDAGATLRFDALAARLRGTATRDVLLFLDVHDATGAVDAMRAAEHVDAALHAMRAREEPLGVLVGVHGAMSLAFTRLVVETIGDPAARDASGAAPVSAVFARVREHSLLSASVASFAHVKGKADFVLAAPEATCASAAPPSAVPSSIPSSMRGRASRPPRSVAPRPSVAPILAEAERAQAGARWDDALAGYKNALMVAGDEDAAVKASLYASIGEVKRSQGKLREAETNFEKALGLDPKHRRSIDALVAMAIESGDWARAASNRRRLVTAATSDVERAVELGRVAELLEKHAGDRAGAIAALEEARALAPHDAEVLGHLRALYAAANRWGSVAEILATLVAHATSPDARAELRFEQADVVLGRVRDEAAGLALLEAALEDQPSHGRALAALVAVRTRRAEWRALERVYTHLIDRFAAGGDPTHAWDVCRRLAALRRDRLHDGPGALDALRGALRCKPSDVESRGALAELLVAKGELGLAVDELEIAASHEPARASTHRRLFELHRRTGAVDRAWLSATALEELGAANVDHDMMVQQFRGGARASAALGPGAWSALLRAPGADDVVARVLSTIGPAAVSLRVAELAAARRLTALDPAAKQAPASTASIVRTFAWASHVLGIPLPELYVMDAVPGGLAAAQVAVPSTAIGPSVMSGKSVSELSFVVGRHLAYYRPEHYALVFYPTVNELTALFLAGVRLVMPQMPVPAASVEATARIERELSRFASAADLTAVRDAVRELDARGGKVDLGAWIRSVELTATRAGLLVCGDLHVAMGALRAESRAIADVTLGEKRDDLLAFSASRALGELRAELGIAARASLAPPLMAPPSSRPPPSSSRPETVHEASSIIIAPDTPFQELPPLPPEQARERHAREPMVTGDPFPQAPRAPGPPHGHPNG